MTLFVWQICLLFSSKKILKWLTYTGKQHSPIHILYVLEMYQFSCTDMYFYKQERTFLLDF